MSRNNIKVMTDDELQFLNNRYMFQVDGSQILVKIQNYDRVTAHPLDKGFSLNTRVRKVDITADAIKLWNDAFKSNYTLFEVQNAINILISTYQTPSFEDIADQLKRGNAEIKIV